MPGTGDMTGSKSNSGPSLPGASSLVWDTDFKPINIHIHI